jgi:hypothetical protein
MSRSKNRNQNKHCGRNYNSLVPFDVLEAAIAGDKAAIGEIVGMYGNYILQLVKTDDYSPNGRKCFGADKLKSDIMKVALMEGIPQFIV